MEVEWPTPTQAESETLSFHITDWQDREPIEQGICLAVLRGHRDIPAIAKYLGLKANVVESRTSKTLIGKGLLWDNHRLIIH